MTVSTKGWATEGKKKQITKGIQIKYKEEKK